MKAIRIYDESDVQGPHIILCEACFEASQYDIDTDSYSWLEGTDWRCSCCGSTADNDTCEQPQFERAAWPVRWAP